MASLLDSCHARTFVNYFLCCLVLKYIIYTKYLYYTIYIYYSLCSIHNIYMYTIYVDIHGIRIPLTITNMSPLSFHFVRLKNSSNFLQKMILHSPHHPRKPFLSQLLESMDGLSWTGEASPVLYKIIFTLCWHWKYLSCVTSTFIMTFIVMSNCKDSPII